MICFVIRRLEVFVSLEWIQCAEPKIYTTIGQWEHPCCAKLDLGTPAARVARPWLLKTLSTNNAFLRTTEAIFVLGLTKPSLQTINLC